MHDLFLLYHVFTSRCTNQNMPLSCSLDHVTLLHSPLVHTGLSCSHFTVNLYTCIHILFIQDDVETAIKEVNEILGELPAASSYHHTVFNQTRSLLTVEHRCLNPDNEMRKLFGSKVVQSDSR